MKPIVNEHRLIQAKSQNMRSQNYRQIGFSQPDIGELHIDVFKQSGKMRVPFIELLNQQQQAVANGKVYKKASNCYIPTSKTQQLDCPQKVSSSKKIDSIKAKQSSLVNCKTQVGNNYKVQGTNSIQLIKVVESSQVISDDRQKSSLGSQKRYKIEINEQAIANLLQRESLQEDLSFCTIVGKTKTGKSFLLNRLINLLENNQQNHERESSTFSVDHTLAPCTKGIWISQQSFPLSTMSTRQKSKQVFFLDTPGLGSYESTQQLDYKLLTLSILMADVLVYNSIGPIDEHMLNGMSLAVEISKLIVQEQEKGNGNGNTPNIVNLPALLWLLRDFSLELLTADNKQISENQYLEKCLQMESKQCNMNMKSGANKVKSKENIRTAIKSIFTQRQCCSLVMPFDEQGKVREEFTEKLIEVKNKLLGLIDDNSDKQKCKPNKTVPRIQEFIFRLRAFVQFLNCQQSSNNKKSFQFPKFQSLQTSLNKAKVLHEFKRVNQNYNRLFVKYEQTLDNLQSSVDCKQQYLRKVQKLRKRLQEEVLQTRNYFQAKIQEMLMGNKQLVGKCGNSKQTGNRNQLGLENDLKQLLNKASDDPLINVVSQRYFAQCDTLRLRFSQIDQKIIKNVESFRQQQNEELNNIREQIQRLIEIYNATSSVSELKRVYDSSVKKVKMIIEEKGQPKPQSQTLLKQLQINYLKHKVTLMQQSQLQFSNQSAQSANSDINFSQQKQGYKQCTNCEKSFYIPYIIIPSHELLQIKFLKTIVKEMHRQYTQGMDDSVKMQSYQNSWTNKRLKLEFIIQIELNGKKWYIRRKLKDFIELNNIVGIMFNQQSQQHLLYPSSQFLSAPNNRNQKSMLKLESLSYQHELSEERVRMIKEELNVFLLELNKLNYVRNSRIFQKFVKINKEYLDL